MTTDNLVAQLNRLPAPLLMIVAAGAYFGAAFLGYQLEYPPVPAPAFFPAAGVAVFFLLVVRWRAIAWVAVGSLIAQIAAGYIHRHDLGVALGFGVATLAFIPPSIVMRRRGIVDRGIFNSLEDTRDANVLAAAGTLGSALIALVVAAAAGFNDLGTFFVTWTFGVFLGVGLVTPLFIPHLTLKAESSRPAYLPARPWPIFLLFLVAILGTIAALFSAGAFGMLAPCVILPICVLAVRWVPPRGVGTLVLAASLEIALFSANGYGPFAKFSSGPAQALLISQIAFALLSVTTAIVAVGLTELRAADERYTQLFEEAPGMTVAVERDASGRPTLVNCNRAFLQAIGREREDAIGHPLSEALPHPCSATDFSARDFQSAIERRSTPPREAELATGDGSLLPVLMQSAPYIDDTGSVAGIQATYLDMSDRKRADQLERDNQLIQQDRLALLGTLTAGIAHEVKNPLNFVVNFAEANNEIAEAMDEMLAPRLSVFGDDGAEVRELLDDMRGNADAIQRHATRALDIMMSMLQLSRPGTAEAKPCDLNALAERYAKLAYHGLRAEGREATTQIEFDLEPDLPLAPMVQSDVGRVILNLVGNACEAAGARARELGAAHQPVVKISTSARDSALELRVSDNGAGIPEKVRARIFEPFFTTKAAGAGTGLGLSISKDIVEQHGGSIEVHSVPGELTEFVVSLPLRAKEVAASPPDRSQDPVVVVSRDSDGGRGIPG